MITFVPEPGTVLICDYDELGFKEPLMTKRRRVVVLQARFRAHQPLTLLVVPLSTTQPVVRRRWHYRIPAGRHSYLSATEDVYAKGDMVGPVPVTALDRIRTSVGWEAPVLPREELSAIQGAVRQAIGI